MLSKMLRMAALFDVYGSLLTQRQQEMCRLYYLNDYSLSEISELHGVSRQAIHDTLVRSEQAMEEYEGQFGLIRCSEARRRRLDELVAALRGVSESVGKALHALGGEPGSDSDCDLNVARALLARTIEAVESCQKAAISMEAETGTVTGTDLGGDDAIIGKEGGL